MLNARISLAHLLQQTIFRAVKPQGRIRSMANQLSLPHPLCYMAALAASADIHQRIAGRKMWLLHPKKPSASARRPYGLPLLALLPNV